MTIPVNHIWGFISGDIDQIKYEIGITSDYVLKSRDILDYIDESESTSIGESCSNIVA